MLWFYDQSIRQKLPVTDINAIMTVDILVEEALELPDRKVRPICHLRQPHVLPACCVVTLDVFQEQSNIHENIEVVRLLDLVVLLGIYDEKLVFWALCGQYMELRVVKRGFYDVKLVGRKRWKSEVADLMDLSWGLGLNG